MTQGDPPAFEGPYFVTRPKKRAVWKSRSKASCGLDADCSALDFRLVLQVRIPTCRTLGVGGYLSVVVYFILSA